MRHQVAYCSSVMVRPGAVSSQMARSHNKVDLIFVSR